MITKVFMGRLGNQMCQYAAVKAFKRRYGLDDELNFDFSRVRKTAKSKKERNEKGYENQLTLLSIPPSSYKIDQKRNLSVYQRILLGFYFVGYKTLKLITSFRGKIDDYTSIKKRFEDKIQKYYNNHGLYLYSYGYYDFKNSKAKNKLFVGYYETAKYFNNIRDELLEEFTPRKAPLEKNRWLYEIMKNTESVCVSIRCGDFMRADIARTNYVCTPEYFYEAFEIIKRKVKDPKFVIFSNDIDWVKKNMKLPEGSVFEDGTDPVWEKLRLMYSCKHFILSNSTFSWWSQFLSRNDKDRKIVVAPNKWRNTGYKGDDLYEDSWEIVDVERLKK